MLLLLLLLLLVHCWLSYRRRCCWLLVVISQAVNCDQLISSHANCCSLCCLANEASERANTHKVCVELIGRRFLYCFISCSKALYLANTLLLFSLWLTTNAYFCASEMQAQSYCCCCLCAIDDSQCAHSHSSGSARKFKSAQSYNFPQALTKHTHWMQLLLLLLLLLKLCKSNCGWSSNFTCNFDTFERWNEQQIHCFFTLPSRANNSISTPTDKIWARDQKLVTAAASASTQSLRSSWQASSKSSSTSCTTAHLKC